jgi:protein associated with RNAse G/E
MNPPASLTVKVFKHDGTENRRWSGRVSHREGPLLMLEAEFDADVTHHLLGEIKRGTRTVEYYWLDRWYNVFQFLADDGRIRLWYCNINTPPQVTDNEISYVDMDIDILVHPDFSFEVLDVDEFEENAKRYGYSEMEKRNARAAANELISMIVHRQFPFEDPSALYD